MKTNFIVIEREKEAFEFVNVNTFDNKDDAYRSMTELYNELNACDSVVNSIICDNYAEIELNDGNVIRWDIKQIQSA